MARRLQHTLVLSFALSAWPMLVPHEARADEPAKSMAATKNERILVVLAHPDDETMAAKTLQRAIQRGAKVQYLYLTKGEGGIKVETRNVAGVPVAKHTADGLVKTEMGHDKNGLAALRVKELESYHRRFGEASSQRTMVDGNPDAWHGGGRAMDKLIGNGKDSDWNAGETRALIAKTIESTSPDYVITLSDSHDTHPGHQAAYRLTQDSVDAVAKAREASGDKRPPPGVFRILEDGWYEKGTFDSMTKGQDGRVVETPLGRGGRAWKRYVVRAFASQPAGHMTEHNHDLKEMPKSERLVASNGTSAARVKGFHALVGTKPSIQERVSYAAGVVKTAVRPSNPSGMNRVSVTPMRPMPTSSSRSH